MLRNSIVFGVLSMSLFGCASGSTHFLPALDAKEKPAREVATDDESEPGLEVAGDDRPAVAANGPWIGAAGASGSVMPGSRDSALGVWVDVPNTHREAKVPVALSLIVDTSGSMAGDKIQNARAAAQRMVDGLSDGDIVSVGSFSDSARELIPPTVLDHRTRMRIQGTLSELRADGGTNMFEGLSMGERFVHGAPVSHVVRRVVLISDGIANVGPSTPEVLGHIAQQGADRGIQVTAMGVGLDYDETTLNALAVRSSGRLYHLGKVAELGSILEEELRLLQATMATQAFVEIVPAPGVQLLSVQGAHVERWNNGFKVPMGAMFAGQHREMLVRVRIDAPQTGSHPLASVRLHFQDPSEGNLERVQEVVARYDVTDQPSIVASSSNAKTQSIIAMMDAGDVAIRAAQDVNNDRFDFAERDLMAAEQQLRSSAQQVKSKKDKDRIIAQANKLTKARESVSAAAAAPPAARPAAKRAGALEANDVGMDSQGF